MATHEFELFFVGQGTADVEVEIPESSKFFRYENSIPVSVEAATRTPQELTLTLKNSNGTIVPPTQAMGEIDATFTLEAASDSGLMDFSFTGSNDNVLTATPVAGTTNKATITFRRRGWRSNNKHSFCSRPTGR